jgi:glutamyl/glutaminyl-tRNA synthetase
LAIESTLKSVASELGIKPGVIIHPTRLACTGSPVGPSLYHLMEVLGKDRVLSRLTQAQQKMA